jgi:hypothetical protein
VLYLYLAELCGFYCCYSRVSRVCLYCLLLRFRLAYSIMLLNRLGYVCIRVFDFYYYNLIHSRLLYVLEYLLYITGGVDLATLAVATDEALRRTNNFRWSQPHQRWRLKTRTRTRESCVSRESISQFRFLGRKSLDVQLATVVCCFVLFR